MSADSLYGKIVQTGDLDVTQRIHIYSRCRTRPDQLRGLVRLVDNDGLCDIYEVYFDGALIGEIEAYDNRVLWCPDYDGVGDDIFEVVQELV